MAKRDSLVLHCTNDTVWLLREILQDPRYRYLQFNKRIKLSTTTTFLKFSALNFIFNPPSKELLPKFKNAFGEVADFDRELKKFITTL